MSRALRPRAGWLAVAPAAFVASFFGWPVVAILRRGVLAGGLLPTLTDASVRRVAWFTLWQASLSTLLTVGIGVAPAYVLARTAVPGRRIITALVSVPFVLPTVVVGAAFLALLPRSLHGTVWAILLAHVYFNLAVVIRTVGASWRLVDRRLEEVARTLGAGRWGVLREVTVPLVAPAILGASSIVFLFTFTSFGVIRMLGGPTHATIEIEIYRRTAQQLDLGGAAALAIVQLVAIGVVLGWLGRLQRRHAVAQRLRPAVPPPAARNRWPSIAVVGATVAFVVVPLGRLVERSFASSNGHGLGAYRALFSHERAVSGRPASTADPAPLASLAVSARYAVATMVISVLIGWMAAAVIAQRGRLGRWLDGGLMLPLGTSAVTVGFGLLITFNRPPVDLRGSSILLPLAHSLIAIPFVVRSIVPALRSIEPRLRDAAATLGAGPWRAWREVDLPVTARALAVGASFAFAVSLGEFGATSFLTRRGQATLPIVIVRLLGRPGALNASEAYALATILMLATFAAVLVIEAVRPPASGGF